MAFLKEYSELITLIFSGIVTIATVFYVLLTSKLVSESRMMRFAQVEPQVIPYFHFGEMHINYLYFTLRNVGLGVAYNVSFQIIEDFNIEGEPRFTLEKCNALTKGIKYLPPNTEHKYFIGTLIGRTEEKLSSKVKLKVSYSDVFKRQKREIFELNLEEFGGKSKITPPDSEIGNIGHWLEKIHKVIEKKSH